MGDSVRQKAVLALANGSVFWGESIGASGARVGEVVFNTAMTGYQEILTDPSYCRQIVTLTYPHIGNTGATALDDEADSIWASGLVIRDLPLVTSSWRAEESLAEFLIRRDVVAIAEIDTRQLTRVLRDQGAQNGCLMAAEAGTEIDREAMEAEALSKAKQFAGLQGMDLAKVVSTKQSYTWTDACWSLEGELAGQAWDQPETNDYTVVALDFGVKRNILRLLAERGCKLTVVPAETPAADILALNPDGVFLSNGPGDPEPCDYAISAIQTILEQGIPVFGICLGHQLLSLASGASTVKMKFGHHGANHPVQDLASQGVAITSQNHGFAVDEDSLPDTLVPTHRSLFDGSLQGVQRNDCPAFGFQGHPEASPGPHDIAPLFDRFIAMMQQRKGA